MNDAISSVLQTTQTTWADAQQAMITAYTAALQRHDWQFEYSDDHQVYLRGNQMLKELALLQRELDPDYKLWNRYASTDYKVTP